MGKPLSTQGQTTYMSAIIFRNNWNGANINFAAYDS